jgi:hypothetical protein
VYRSQNLVRGDPRVGSTPTAGIFVVGSLLLAVATCAFLANSICRDEYAEIRSRLLEFWAIYQTGKIELIRKSLTLERLVMEERLYMLRIASRGNNTLYLYVPPHWTEYNFSRLEAFPSVRGARNHPPYLGLFVSRGSKPFPTRLGPGTGNFSSPRRAGRG